MTKPKLITYRNGQVHFPRWPKFDRWLETYETFIVCAAVWIVALTALAVLMIGGGE